jgi:hypothetical protein
MWRSFPSHSPIKPAALLVTLILAGCGGAGKGEPSSQVVQGAGFRFAAPFGWTVTRTKDTVAAVGEDPARVEVRTFRLVRPYRPKLFDAVARELDAAVARVADQLSGRITSRETIRAGGRRARAYRIEYDGKVQELTFVLRNRLEYQLLCRRVATDDGEACRQLVESFALT